MAENPFEVTKAVDFTDAEIEATWVDLPGGGFVSLADPRSPMPMFLVGGKGGGRTHLLRYSSYALQRLRHKEDLIGGIQRDGYVGIYFRCGGLNSSRFAGKRQDADTWAAAFSYYTEVWLGRLTIDLILDLFTHASLELWTDEVRAFTEAVRELFDIGIALPAGRLDPLRELASAFHSIQRQLDVAINNAALTHRLDVEIGASPGRLVFGVPRAATEHLQVVAKLVFAYLLDEYENLTFEQQRYVNTLLREKELPTTFLVGSRRYGLRTHGTLSAGEENRQGSEYDLVILENAYRSEAHRYSSFCADIVRRRLVESGFDIGPHIRLDEYFAGSREQAKPLEELAIQHVTGRPELSARRPWLERLGSQLRRFGRSRDATVVLAAVEFPESPLHEKFANFLVYRAWADGENLPEASKVIRRGVEQLLAGEKGDKLAVTYKHYRLDLYAQLLDDLGMPQEYYGFDDFVRMSGYLPRNLLVVLKQITRWSLFLGDKPFRGTKISLKAQREGVREASAWFLSDSKGLGRLGEETQLAIRRLASLFRAMRFSDKPVEVSCSAFATNRQGLTAAAVTSLDDAVSHSLILEVPNGRRERNIHVLQHKYQLNPMLAPLFDLSLALRGVANFGTDELNAIFDPAVADSQFGAMQRRLLDRMRAPFQGSESQDALVFE